MRCTNIAAADLMLVVERYHVSRDKTPVYLISFQNIMSLLNVCGQIDLLKATIFRRDIIVLFGAFFILFGAGGMGVATPFI